ncbi:hypothetical protein Avbf_09999 [Armadillidium vulgare]|nr:hypothetical protein Avbf_09999 [Armadillidium vulgare]
MSLSCSDYPSLFFFDPNPPKGRPFLHEKNLGSSSLNLDQPSLLKPLNSKGHLHSVLRKSKSESDLRKFNAHFQVQVFPSYPILYLEGVPIFKSTLVLNVLEGNTWNVEFEYLRAIVSKVSCRVITVRVGPIILNLVYSIISKVSNFYLLYFNENRNRLFGLLWIQMYGYFYESLIIVLTDGEVWNIDQLIELIQRHADDTRVFSVGIGDGASTALVEGMAMAGKGRCEMVADESQFQTRVMGLIGSMLQENVKDLTVECKVTPPQEVKLVPKISPNFLRSINNLHEDIINLSISSSVVCKLTSFVGFDQDNKVIKEKAREYPTYPEMDAAAYCMMSAPMGKSVCRIKKNKSATVALELYDEALISCAADLENSIDYVEEGEGSEFLRCAFVGGGNEPLSEEDMVVEQEKDTLVDLISFQQFDGSWSLNDCLNLLNIDENFCKTIQSKVSLDDVCLGTVLILAYLELKFDSRKEEWKIVALKGHKFLKVNKIDSADVVQKCSLELKDKI